MPLITCKSDPSSTSLHMPGIQTSRPTHSFFRQPFSSNNFAEPASDHQDQHPDNLDQYIDQPNTPVQPATSGPSGHDSQLGFYSDEDLVNLMTDISAIQADGLPTIDESLLQDINLDETGDESDYTDPPPPEANSGNISEQFLLTVVARLKREITEHKRPRIYSEGTFWIRPRDPAFALEASRFGTDREQCINPRELYYLEIFVWLPGLPSGLPGEPDQLLCPKCQGKLIRAGELFIYHEKLGRN